MHTLSTVYPIGPAIWALDEADPDRLLARSEAAVDELVVHGLDALAAGLLLASLIDARALENT